jgi:hypothetical protein
MRVRWCTPWQAFWPPPSWLVGASGAKSLTAPSASPRWCTGEFARTGGLARIVILGRRYLEQNHRSPSADAPPMTRSPARHALAAPRQRVHWAAAVQLRESAAAEPSPRTFNAWLPSSAALELSTSVAIDLQPDGHFDDLRLFPRLAHRSPSLGLLAGPTVAQEAAHCNRLPSPNARKEPVRTCTRRVAAAQIASNAAMIPH